MEEDAGGLQVSAVLTTTSWDRIGRLARCLRSLNGQADEAVAVLPDWDMAEAVMDVSPVDVTVVVADAGLAEARNRGAREAGGDVYAFLDDDVVVTRTWGPSVRDAFACMATAAGGPAYPDWETSRPPWLPERWDWLVGCGPYHGDMVEVRNTYGCNIAFRADVFDGLGGFDEGYGMDGDLGQGEEAEICRRMRAEHGSGTLYHPGMEVRHYVPSSKTAPLGLVRRAWAQGRTKARLGLDDEETGFLRDALSEIPGSGMASTVGSVAYLAATAGGYAAERAASPVSR